MTKPKKGSPSPPPADTGAAERHRAANEKAKHQLEELRSERDHGYGSEYIGDEYKDVKVEDEYKDVKVEDEDDKNQEVA
jgi:hypothetical protein